MDGISTQERSTLSAVAGVLESNSEELKIDSLIRDAGQRFGLKRMATPPRSIPGLLAEWTIPRRKAIGKMIAPLRRTPRRAFTLVELLVVIAIIGVLIALLLPAVQAARGAARKAQCSNHLKQLGLAYHNHENTHKALPPSYVSDPTKPTGWGVFLLSFMEQNALDDSYNRDAPFFYVNAAYGIDNQSVANTPIGILSCPSAPERKPYTYTFSFPGYPSTSWQAWASDYSPIAGVGDSLNTYLNLGYSSQQLLGALEPDKTTPFAHLKDGLSNTILVGELAGKNDVWQHRNKTSQQLSGFFGGQGGWADATSAASKLYGSTADGTISPGPCGVNCSNDYGLYGFHAGGANVLLADGSVRLLSETTDINLLVALTTRAGGEVVAID